MKHKPLTARTLDILTLAAAAGFVAVASPDALAQTHVIDVSGGQAINPNIRGQNAPNLGANEIYQQKTLDLTNGSSIRGVAGGLAADSYDWKSRTGFAVGSPGEPGTPTLESLRWARDHNADLFITVNTRGTGVNYSTSDFYFTDTSGATLPTMAADWVRYTNFISTGYKQGDVLSASDQTLINSLQWGSYDKLRGPSEDPTKKVKYWEIGNEPEILFTTPNEPGFTLTPAQYADRYVAITQAMLAVDPTIKVGPSVGRGVLDVNATGSSGGNPGDKNPYLLAVLDRPDAQVDFIGYHPYTALFTEYYTNSTLPTIAQLEERLRYIRPKQESEYQLIRADIKKNNDDNFFGWLGPIRDLNTPVVATEWNPGAYQVGGLYVGRTMAQALGATETVFNFAQNQNMLAAQYWLWPVSLWEAAEIPVTKAFAGLRDHMGDTLVDVLSTDDSSNIRLYTTKNSITGEIVVWGLNFSDDTSQTLQLSLDNLLSGQDYVITLMKLANIDGGDTSLMSYTSASASAVQSIDWLSTDLTGQINLSNFSLTLDDATLTALVIKPAPVPEPAGVLPGVFIAAVVMGMRRRRNPLHLF